MISREQLQDANGILAETISTETGANIPTNTLHVPSVDEVLKYQQGELPLSAIAGARVIVSYTTDREGLYFAPAIVLPDGRFGALDNLVDRTKEARDLKQLTLFQQQLLAGLFAQHQQGIGSHGTSGIAETGHSTLIAISTDPTKIHESTHQFVDSGEFGANVSKQTTIESKTGYRPTGAAILSKSQIVNMLFIPDHQSELPSVNAFEASAGFALAAKSTQHDPRFDLNANAGAMAAQMNGVTG